MIRKRAFLLLLLTFLCLPIVAVAQEKQLRTQSDMIIEAAKDFQDTDKKLINAYNQISKLFASDKEFINLLEQDKTRYYQERNKIRDLVLPHSRTSYGLNNYNVYAPIYMIDLNTQKLKYLKNAVESYCFFHWNEPEGCKQYEKYNLFD